MIFLIVTNRRDLTSDYVVRELKRRNHDFIRLNTEVIPRSIVTIDPHNLSFKLQVQGRHIDVNEVGAAYFRRPENPIRPTDNIEDNDWTYAAGEWNALLKSLYLFVGSRWLSHPGSIMLAEDKPRQLMAAVKLGFKVPRGVITNDIEEVMKISRAGSTIGKPLRSSIVDMRGRGKIVFTSLLPDLSNNDKPALEICPAIYQAEIDKSFDVRVTVVGGKAFSTAIYSQDTENSRIDWRRGSNPDLPHRPIKLPPETEASCVELVRALDLKFGAIDLICDKQGEFWFLECNPNGQWAWIETRTGSPISAAIVDELERISKS